MNGFGTESIDVIVKIFVAASELRRGADHLCQLRVKREITHD